MVDAISLTTILAAFMVVTISPGPANIAVAAVAMRSGRKQGLMYGAGLGCGLAFWGLVVASGMGAVLQSSEAALIVLKGLGGLYMLWLAFQSARSALEPEKSFGQSSTNERWFVRGLVLNLSNPKAVIAWMAALSVGLSSEDSAGELAIAVFLCVIIGFLNYFVHALAFSLSGFTAGYARLHRWIDGTVSGLFAGAGLGLIVSAANR